MPQSNFTEEIKSQIEFLKKLKEDSPNEALKANIDKTLEKIYSDTLSRTDPALRKSETDSILDGLSREFRKAQKDTRMLTWVNLSTISVMILVFFFLINRGYDHAANMIKPYIEAEDRKNNTIDSLSALTAGLQHDVIEKLDVAAAALPARKNDFSAQDSATGKFIDSTRRMIVYMESSMDTLDKRTSNFAKVQNAVMLYITLVIASIFAGIVVLVYLVRLFVNIHRYNTILADHYEALDVACQTLKNKHIFGGENFDLEKAYTVVHPQRDKLLEMYASERMNTDKIEDLAKTAVPDPGKAKPL